MRSLRRTLVVGTTGGMVVVLCVAGLLLHVMVRTSLVSQFDQALTDKAFVLASNVERKAGRVVFEPDELNMDEFQDSDGAAYLELLLSNGSALFRSPSLEKRDIPSPSKSPEFRWVKLSNGHPGREVSFVFMPQLDDEDQGPAPNADKESNAGQTVTLVMARDAASIASTVRVLTMLLFVCGMGTIILSTVLLWLIVRRSLRPLDSVATTIGRIVPEDLSVKIDRSEIPTELQPVVERLNDLLDRLRAAFERERCFSADVAHELRTPLAGLRSMLEVTATRPRTTDEYQATLSECLQIAEQMQSMVENLLTLARLDSGEIVVTTERLSLDELIRVAAKPFEHGFVERRLQLQWNVASQLAIESDPSLLSLVLRNLLDNALAHADEGGWIRIEASEQGGAVRIQISNSGSGVREEDVQHLFDRFWRADTARSKTGLHCGLGLSLVKRIVCLLGGAVTAHSTLGGEFGIDITIPNAA